ncbi:hypothetical protein SAOR_08980 [Salinisphaera orenii MK-B5]|uniref:Uncharacterized protein n=2 Tax=Salinisphaera orenii TaxID=856731 RepID=A0A423PNY6_9GAMM|nr:MULTISPECIES: hypothetical protein [Salinisphaera]ROO27300.1 hypothetical protein SAOR_08980 [Salinisphaera orenii MK-B5]ROO37788.1 hypothetical protein SAHL_00175 [Salinisphaera halophila YIM 95161]
MKRNLTDWDTLERDADRGFEILGREVDGGWEVEVRFDDNTEPQRSTGSRTPQTREEAIQMGREMATMTG